MNVYIYESDDREAIVFHDFNRALAHLLQTEGFGTVGELIEYLEDNSVYHEIDPDSQHMLIDGGPRIYSAQIVND